MELAARPGLTATSSLSDANQHGPRPKRGREQGLAPRWPALTALSDAPPSRRAMSARRAARVVLVTRGGCYLRRRSGSPPVGTKRSASRESSHSERNALAASPRRRGRVQRSPCLAGTRAALLGLRIVSCLSSSIDRSYGRKYGRCGGHAGVFPERAPKRLPRSLSLIPWLRALPVEWGPRDQHPVCAPLVRAFGDQASP